MLHVTTEIGKPGKHERERRHFPGIHNQESSGLSAYRARGRRFIPHNYGTDQEWKPHGQHVDVEYSEAGPDWHSRLRYIRHPENPRYPSAEIFPNNWHAMRPFPFTYKRSDSEWLLDPDLTKVGMRCVWDGVHRATVNSDGEITHQMRFGRGRHEVDIDKRNGLCEASPGDKSYQAVEYSPSFFKQGSARPAASKFRPNVIGMPSVLMRSDTFIPLVPMPPKKRESFKEKEMKKQLEEDIQLVKDLDNWKPATPLLT